MPPYSVALLLAEGLAVGTLIGSGIHLMGAHQNSFQRAIICILAVMLALLDSTLNALVCMTIHSDILLLIMMILDYPHT